MRDFVAELKVARNAQDWAAYERIHDDRRVAEVEYDEKVLHDNLKKVDPQVQKFLHSIETDLDN